MKIKIIIGLLFLPFLLLADTIELSSGKKLENVKIEKTGTEYVIIKNTDGFFVQIPRDKITNINNEKQDDVPTKNYGVTFTQFMWNDVPFRGYSVLGERLSRRNNQSYSSFYNAWSLVSGLSLTTPLEGLTINMNVYNPTVARQRKDSDYYFQTKPGDTTDYTPQVNQTLNSGRLQYNAFLIQPRKEDNKLRDIFDTLILYKWQTALGKITTGFYFANNVNITPITLGELVVGVEFPFLEFLSPTYTAYHRFSSEAGGGGNSTSNHRFSIGHEFFKDKMVSITTSLSAGYQNMNNNKDMINAVSDISPSIKIKIKNFFISLTDMYRPDTSMYDVDPGNGMVTDTNRNDGKTIDPSKIYGPQNQFVLGQINTGVNQMNISNNNILTSDDAGHLKQLIKNALYNNYQQQKIIQHNFRMQIGYSIKF